MKNIKTSLMVALLLSGNLMAVEYGNSPSMKIESSLQEDVPKKTAVRSESQDAASLAQEYLDNNPKVHLGWNEKSRTIVIIATAIRNVDDDPEYSKDFMNMRNMASVEAVLRAKAGVIKAIRTSMSAADILVGPGSDLDSELSKDLKNAQRKLNAQEMKLKKLLKEEGIAYDAFQSGVTFKDRANAFIDAAIKKLDEKYDAQHVLAKKRTKLEKIQKRVAEANEIVSKNTEKLNALKGTIRQTQTSTRELFAKMPIFGATVVEQFESYNDDKEEYKNSVIMMWSPKTEAMSVSMLKGEDVTVPPSQESLQEYLRKNKRALLTTTGGRRFRDNEGNVYFLGIAAQEKGSSASAQRRAMSMAKIEAQTQVAFALYADVKSQEMMTSKEVIRNAGTGKDATQSLTSLSETLSQSFKNMNIQGASEVYTVSGVHPISQKDIFVSVFAISAKSAKNAMKAEASSYLSKIGYLDAQQKSNARKDALVEGVKRKKNDKTTYNKEYLKSSQQVEEESRKQERRTPSIQKSSSHISEGSSQSDHKKRTGSYQGMSGSDSFGW